MARAAIRERMVEHITDYGWCRANQHIWVPQSGNGQGIIVKQGIASVVFKCRNCKGERHDKISLNSGDVVFRTYVMPEGYVLENIGVGNKPKKSDWRKEHYAKLLGRKR